MVSPPWSYYHLSTKLDISVSQVHSALKRCEVARLFEQGEHKPYRPHLKEYLIHGGEVQLSRATWKLDPWHSNQLRHSADELDDCRARRSSAGLAASQGTSSGYRALAHPQGCAWRGVKGSNAI